MIVLALLVLMAPVANLQGVVTEQNSLGGPDLFSSTDEVRKLFEKEINLRRRLGAHLEILRGQIQALDRLIDKNLRGNVTEKEAAEYVAHPVNTYKMIKRAALQWPQVKKKVFDKGVMKEWEDIRRELKESFPVASDVHGAFNGIFLLHETYEMDLKKFSRGLVEVPGSGGKREVAGEIALTDKDLDVLAKLAFNRGFYNRACEWSETALWRAEEDGASAARVKHLRNFLDVLKKKHDEVLLAKGSPVGKGWRTNALPFNTSLRKKKKFRKVTEARNRPEHKLFATLTDQELWENFNALCRGENLRPVSDFDAKLTCVLLDYGDPYLRLGPFRMEVLNRDENRPFVAVFRDFMPDAESQEFLEMAQGRLHRSMHKGKNGASSATSVKRTSAQAWLSEFDATAAASNHSAGSVAATKMSLRLKLATRLHTHRVMGAEPYQIANYGIGGVYNHHTDASGSAHRDEQDEFDDSHINGDRIATAMAYLTDVAAGGATVFPNLGVTLWPRKGDLAFWYNIDRNLNVDYLTFHGGCPVLVGSKWITNKWIRAYDQWDRYRCESDESKRWLMLRIPALDNKFCKMTPVCGESRLFSAYSRGRAGWRDHSKVEDIPHQWWRRQRDKT